MGSIVLTHLKSAWHVDQAILDDEEKIVVLRFGKTTDAAVMAMDEHLSKIADRVQNFASIYVVDNKEVPDFNAMYELYDACTVMFFFRNKHILVDCGTGNNNKINFSIADKQDLIDIIEVVYRGARKGKGLVVSPKDYATQMKY
ncbi:thioredoxin-like protein-like protein 4A [Lophiostoma macrostomum CBS 122681]|uniref:Spliceosomal protein DIB1 n=1 Tax=Lophiostoma macrostomum CBS 122681 TaxID=1314788 RepID=A0A6A6TFN3_9PLEO|nr:thioredoxin-like protein-like protein 4A [Lophiostoma macrostomum CBS 122681]